MVYLGGVDVKSAFICVEPKVEHLRDLTVVKQLAAKLAVIHHAARAAVHKVFRFRVHAKLRKSSRIADNFVFTLIHAFRDNPYGQEVRGAPSSGWGFHPQSGMYLLNVYSVFKVHEEFVLSLNR